MLALPDRTIRSYMGTQIVSPHSPWPSGPCACMWRTRAGTDMRQGRHNCLYSRRNIGTRGRDTRLVDRGDAAAVATDGCSEANAHSVSKWSGSQQSLHGLLDPGWMASTVVPCRLAFNSCQGCRTSNAACCWWNHLSYSSQPGPQWHWASRMIRRA